MKIITFIKHIFFTTVAVAAVQCKSNIPDSKSIKYSRIEIYCWCFLSENVPSGRFKDCEGPVAVTPSSLINSKYLLDSTSNPKIINALQKLIFDKKENVRSIDYIDARFVLLFRKDRFNTDRIILAQNDLCYNDKYLFSYSFDVMDSIRSILNVERIDCPD